MRVLLISANTEQINMPVLPLGLAYVAAAVQGAGHEIKILNLMTHKSTPDLQHAIKAAITAFRPQIIGISVRNIDDQNMENPKFLLESVKDVVRICRRLSDATLVLGGAGYSIFPQAALDFLQADIGIKGEGESAFLDLLDRLRDKKDLSGIPGLYLAQRECRNQAEHYEKLTDFPLPLPDVHLSTPSVLKDQEIWIPFQTRRGCPLDCSYCSTASIEGRVVRKQDLNKVIRTLVKYVEAGWGHFFFVDNTFNLPAAYAQKFCEQLIAAQLNITWRCILYPWKVDDRLAETMAAAGCREVSLGFESGSPKILTLLNKRFSPDDIRRISTRLKNAGIRRTGFLLLGGPGETRETVNESLEFADSLDLEALKITIGIRIYPHTALARTAVSEGLIAANDNLLLPKFYIVKNLESWLRKTVAAWRQNRPHWIM
jgi:radical SAM superfamily enzyme YgiQ (UPF0313 family)